MLADDAIEAPSILVGGGEMGARLRADPGADGPLGPVDRWPQSLRTACDVMLNSRHPMFLAWGPELCFLYNDAYAPILGAKHPGALVQPFARIWPEIWDDISPLIDRALAGEPTWAEDMHLVMQRNGYPEDTWYTFSYSPLRDETGTVAGMFCACTETTSKVIAERRLKFLLELGDMLRGSSDPQQATAIAAEALGRHLGVGRAGYGEIDTESRTITVERDWTDGTMRSLSGEAFSLEIFGPVIELLRAGETVAINDVPGEARSAPYEAGFDQLQARAVVGVPLVREGQLRAVLSMQTAQPRHWTEAEIGLAQDVAERTWDAVERARAELALRESEARFRAMADSAPSPVWVTSAPGGVEFVNQAFVDYSGLPRERLLGDVWISLIHPDDVRGVAVQREEARRRFTAYGIEARFRRYDGEWRLMQANSNPRFDAAGVFQGYVGLAIDITDIRSAETHQQLLINELNHRVKNTLATVQSISHQTLREGVVTREARDLLTARLLALSAAHDVLTRENWEGAELKQIAAEAVRPYDGAPRPRISLDGPSVRVGPRVSLALSMALHELATNAAKYGALSGDAGEVAIRWERNGEAIELEWRETGGPPVTAPKRRGFGSRLLEQGLATELRGAAQLDYRPEGLVCVIRTPVAGR